MKGVILHGGAGTRLRPLTYAGPKQLIPVANKPISQYALEDLVNAGVKEVAIVLGETFPELVREHYGDGSRFGVKIAYVYQGPPKGIAHAVGLCRSLVGDESFIVYLGDNILQHGIKDYAEHFSRGGYDAMVLLKEVEDPRSFGVAEVKDGRLVRLVEKPKAPPSNYALVGVYFFKPLIFDAIERLKPSWRGEYEITDAIQSLIDEGYNVGYRVVDGWWFDTGKRDDVLKVNAAILDERVQRDVRGEAVNSSIEGRVSVGRSAKIVGSVIRGPAVVGEGAYIEGSFIGPYTSIGDGVRVVKSSIEHSIIMSGAVLEHVDRVEDSLIGRNARVVKGRDRNAYRLSLADYSEVIL